MVEWGRLAGGVCWGGRRRRGWGGWRAGTTGFGGELCLHSSPIGHSDGPRHRAIHPPAAPKRCREQLQVALGFELLRADDDDVRGLERSARFPVRAGDIACEMRGVGRHAEGRLSG